MIYESLLSAITQEFPSLLKELNLLFQKQENLTTTEAMQLSPVFVSSLARLQYIQEMLSIVQKQIYDDFQVAPEFRCNENEIVHRVLNELLRNVSEEDIQKLGIVRIIAELH